MSKPLKAPFNRMTKGTSAAMDDMKILRSAQKKIKELDLKLQKLKDGSLSGKWVPLDCKGCEEEGSCDGCKYEDTVFDVNEEVHIK
jgi:hypothetical protein